MQFVKVEFGRRKYKFKYIINLRFDEMKNQLRFIVHLTPKPPPTPHRMDQRWPQKKSRIHDRLEFETISFSAE